MFNATFRLLVAAALTATLTTACGDKDKDAATGLLADAQAQFEARQFNSALATLDTLDARYPAQVDIRRDAMHLRPKVIEAASLAELASTDSLIAVLTISGDSLRSTLTYVPDSFEGYYTSSRISSQKPADAPGLYARMSPEGVFTLISSAKKGTESTAVTLSAAGAEASTAHVACDGERNDRSRGVEIITFMPAECDTIGHFAFIHKGQPLTVSFIGSKTATQPLSTDQAEALAEVWSASRILGSLRMAQMRKTHLERTLDIARSQMARTYRDDPTPAAE
ncbi:MAG: hypothetical protein HDR77_11790 [Bacteroides sp.]|nr:hypothetical protein [Bacteroides sp.]